MASSGYRLSRKSRRDAMTVPSLHEARERFLSHQRARNHSRKQLEHYARSFHDFGRFLESTDRPATMAVLTTASFEAFIQWLKETPLTRIYRGSTQRSITGIHGHMKDLRAFVHWCIEEELVDWRVKVPVPKLPRRLFPILSESDLLALFQATMMTGQTEAAIRNRALLALLLDTGIRLGELAGLTPQMVQGRYLRVVGKGDKERIVPFQPEAAKLLADWLKVRSAIGAPETEPLFLLKYAGIVMLVKRLRRQTGVDIFPHKVRHTTATQLIRAGVDLHSVKELLGHTTITTTEAYLSLSREDLMNKHSQGSPFALVAQHLPDTKPQQRRKRYRLE